MEQINFKFDENSFNKLFPFYILIDDNLLIRGIGKSLMKTFPNINLNENFLQKFSVKRPFLTEQNFENLKNIANQLIVIETHFSGVQLRGQLQPYENYLLFVGTPWFVSMEEVVQNNLTLHDFAFHDPSLDLLHVLKVQEITNEDLKVLLAKINDQKKKLKKDQEELNRLALVASTNENGVFFTDLQGVIFWCNAAYLQLTGRTKEEIIGKTAAQIGSCEQMTIADLKKLVDSFFKKEKFEVEVPYARKNHNPFWAKIKAQPVCDQNGQLSQYFAVIEDITEKNASDLKLIESENRLAFLIKNLQTGIIVENENRQILLANKKFSTLFGFDPNSDSLIGKNAAQIMEQTKHYFAEPTSYLERLRDVLQSKQPVLNEELELSDGRIIERSYVPIIQGGRYSGNLTSYVDVTFKKKFENSLKNEKEKYSNIIANMNLGLIEVDMQDKITFANHSFSQMSGYKTDELVGTEVKGLFLTDENQSVVAAKMKLRTEGISDLYEIVVKNKQQQERSWLISAAPNYDVSGKMIGSIGIHLDITAQKAQEEELYLLSLIAEKNINSVVICDNHGNIEWVNSSFEMMSGYTKKELIGLTPGKVLQGPESKPETINYIRNQIKRGHPFNCEILNYTKSKQKYWVRVQGQALYNKKNEIVRYFAIQENITNQKKLENQQEQLVESLAKTNQELEQYAQMVSHDLKSPLHSIHSLLTWIKEDNDVAFTAQTLQYFELIENKVEKMDHLIDGILTYSRIGKDDCVVEEVSIQELIQFIIEIIHVPKHITIHIKNQLPKLTTNRYRIQQLFQNVIVNAVNYIDKEVGEIEIEAKEYQDSFVFSIKDNGIGIDKENYDKVFNTFQSFTQNKNSTGLGLAIVKKIIEAEKGKIWIESEVGVGSTFFIKIIKQ
ncbi:PAS domain S-box protein [Flavobacterium sp. GNP001]